VPIFKNGPMGDTAIYYEQRGQGFPLLLLSPGGLNATIEFWGFTAFNAPEVLSQWFRVITFDTRNAGRSSGPLDMEDPWGSFAKDHIGLMNHLGIDRFHVLGCCVGTSHALRLMKEVPKRVVASVLEQPVGIDESNRTFYPNVWKTWAEGMMKKHPDMKMETLEAYGRKMWDGEFVLSVERDWMKTCQTPTLVLPGIDQAHPNAVGKEVAKLLPNSEKLEPWKEPAELIPPTIQRIRKFLQTHTPS